MITDEKRAELRAGREARRQELRDRRNVERLLEHDKATRGCGWNHWAHSHALDSVIKKRPADVIEIAKRGPRKKQSDGPAWVPLTNGLEAVECNSEYTRGNARCQSPRRVREVERKGYQLSYTDAVQHGIVVEH